MAEGYYLGIDLGSVSLDAMVLDGRAGRLLWHAYRRVHGRSRDALAGLCRQLLGEWIQPEQVKKSVSAPTGSECLTLAMTHLSAETCLPVKLLFGHVASLEKEG